MKQPLFTGVCTALITPFLGGKVNYPMLEILLRRQMDSGIPAVAVCGTTGEASTLTDSEKLEIFQRTKQICGDKMRVIAGTGSNNTHHSVMLSIAAEKAGADALLVVSPYYNKANSQGLFAHYKAINDAVNIPIIVYNVPSRTGVDIPEKVYAQLSKLPNIAGIKEASASIQKFGKIRQICDLPIWSGNDNMITPVISLGGQGVISVLSNVAPLETKLITEAALSGDFDTAADLHCQLLPLMDALSCDVNPIPVKAAMKLIGYDCGGCRLPLTELSDENIAQLKMLLM